MVYHKSLDGLSNIAFRSIGLIKCSITRVFEFHGHLYKDLVIRVKSPHLWKDVQEERRSFCKRSTQTSKKPCLLKLIVDSIQVLIIQVLL